MQAHELFHDTVFRKSDKSGDTGCVEIARRADRIGVRDSKDRAATPLVFVPRQWQIFTDGVKSGDFDLPGRPRT